jgi:FAD dependent oxidoreductase TIGR03364
VLSAGGRVNIPEKIIPLGGSLSHVELRLSSYDLAVIGGGILGLAHAFAGSRLGKRVVVIERDSQANGASIRNFGFITVTGQARGATWRRAWRSRDIWAAIAPRAGIDIHQAGLLVCLRHPEAVDVAEAFIATEMGERCRLISPKEVADRSPGLGGPDLLAALWSPHEVRVDSPSAIPRLTAWLAETHGVTFMTGTAALQVAPPRIDTSRGPIEAAAAVVCPGDDFVSLFPDPIAARGLDKSTLTMLRLAAPGRRLPATVMSDLSLTRYLGYAELPVAARLRARLQASHAEALAHGIHLIVAQGADGQLIVGDSHHYNDRADPFMDAQVEALILKEFADAMGFEPPPVVRRWIGSYAHDPREPMFVETPHPGVRLVMVTSGTGASTSFAIAEEVVGSLFGSTLEKVPLWPT